ncbi:MAG: ABC transporter permease [Thermococcus sp.]|uniref:ABC transporter permease n=1 Tax=Thermococcus sp. TaxID=35749 RepID=UPI002635EC5C|nr:ABC transporter permease [Thermococcus sp.]MCD6141047.1 ABC transporter permease [Thermococcus sp.]
MFFRYPLRVISSILVGIVFLLQFVFFGQAVLGGRYSALLEVSTGMGDYPTYALIGYVLWWVSVSPMEAYVWGVRRELQRGTFEMNILSPAKIVELLSGLAISWLLMDSVLMMIVFAIGVVIFAIPLTLLIILKSLPIVVASLIAFSKLFPLTHAAAVVRGLFVGKGYLEVWGEVAWLLVLIPVYWGIGYLIFKWAERITRVIGYGGY